jgi:pilus assembly protein CpaC
MDACGGTRVGYGLWVAAALLVMCSAAAARAENNLPDEQINLIVGQQRVLSLQGVTRIAIGNPAVANVNVTKGGDILITAVAEGVTELTVWRGTRITTYAISVSEIDIKQLSSEVRRLLGKREGITVRVSGDRIYIEGNALVLEDLEQADEIAGLYKQVKSLVKLDPSAHNMIAEQINKLLAGSGLATARATVVGSTIFLEGTVDTEADLKKAEILVQSVGKNIQSLLRVVASRMVEAEVEFVEVSLNSLDKIGFKWPTDVTGSLNGTWTKTIILDSRPNAQEQHEFGFTGDATASFGVSLQFNDGATRVLARPTLVTASGQKAEFLAGGEIPVPIVTMDRIQIEWKQYGVRLVITPTIDITAIQTLIEAEVSQIDPSVAVMNIPGFLTRRVKTQVSVKDGETIVLGGLLQRFEGKDVSKVPLLGHIPIIGELFKSRSFQEKKTDLVIFITPRLIDPSHERVRNAIMEMTKRYQLGGEEVSFSIFD